LKEIKDFSQRFLNDVDFTSISLDLYVVLIFIGIFHFQKTTFGANFFYPFKPGKKDSQLFWRVKIKAEFIVLISDFEKVGELNPYF